MALFLSPIGNEQQMDANGDPLNAGKIYSYLAGSTTSTATYTDNTGATAQANPIILNSLGLPSSPIWLTGGITYKFIIKDSTDVTLRTVDNISGINDTTATQTEWVGSGFVPTFISTVSFTVPGDQTGTLQIGRRLQTQNTAGTIYSRITNSVFGGAVTTVTVVNDSGVLDSGLSSVAYGLAAPISPSLPNSVAVRDTMGITTAMQSQEGIAYTTAGTSTAYTLTPSPAISAYVANQSFYVRFNAASGAAPTLTISGVATPPNLVKQNPDGSYSNIAANDIPADHRSRVTLLSATQALVEDMPPIVVSKIQPITASVGSNALTLTLNPTTLDFRSATLGSGTVNTRNIATAISVVISSGSTLGTVSAIASQIAVIAIDNAGTIELAAVNLAGSLTLDETVLISTTAEGGAGAADSASVIYSTTARASVPFRVVGYIESTQATAGTWATAPSTIQGQGGQAITGLWHRSTSATAVASTSGTAVGFTGIPLGVKRITMNLKGVSLSGTDNYLVQIGAGSYIATGYTGASVTLSNAPAITAFQFGAGFGIVGGGANVVLEGSITLTLLTAATNTWCCAINLGRSDAAIALTGGGSLTLSGALDRVQITSSGVNTFDAGTVNVTWEY